MFFLLVRVALKLRWKGTPGFPGGGAGFRPAHGVLLDPGRVGEYSWILSEFLIETGESEHDMLAAAPPRHRVVIDKFNGHPPGPLRYRVLY